jgi:hypothetical protein
MSRVKVQLDKPVFRRFDRVRSGLGEQTVVRVKSRNGAHTMRCKNIKWSKYRLINYLIKFWIIIRY